MQPLILKFFWVSIFKGYLLFYSNFFKKNCLNDSIVTLLLLHFAWYMCFLAKIIIKFAIGGRYSSPKKTVCLHLGKAMFLHSRNCWIWDQNPCATSHSQNWCCSVSTCCQHRSQSEDGYFLIRRRKALVGITLRKNLNWKGCIWVSDEHCFGRL